MPFLWREGKKMAKNVTTECFSLSISIFFMDEFLESAYVIMQMFNCLNRKEEEHRKYYAGYRTVADWVSIMPEDIHSIGG